MSAVVALLGLDGALSERSIAVGARMAARLAHRGPDGQSVRHDGPAWLAHGLLITTDDDARATVPCSPDAALVMAADARIDNREEVAAQLGRGPTSDVDTIFAAYERWGDHFATRLVGDFAVVIWDGRRRRLVCVRDALGQRTLFWTIQDRTFRCASEMDALFADPTVPRAPHLPSLALFLAEEYLERDQTLYQGVFALPPGHVLTIGERESAPTVRRYWALDPTREIRHRTREDYNAHFRSVFEASVAARLRSSTAPRVLVSGGLDSSALIGVAESLRRSGRGGRHPLTMVHVAFPGLPCDELRYSEAVAERWRVPTTEISATDVELPQPGGLAPDRYFSPLDLLLEKHFEEARALGARVTLTGLGADQLMQVTGAEPADAALHGRWLSAARFAGIGASPLSARAWLRGARRTAGPLLRSALPVRLRGSTSERPWLSPTFREAVAEHRELSRAKREAGAARGRSRRLLAHQFAHGHELVFGVSTLGRLAARFGAEIRHPYLDIRLVELVLAFPDEVRCGFGPPKPLVRDGLSEFLPAEVRARRKPAEFSPFVHRVLFGEDGTATPPGLDGLVAGSRLAALDLVRPRIVRSLVAEARRDWSAIRHVANLLALELWLRQSFP